VSGVRPSLRENLADLLDFKRPYGLLVRFAAYTGLRAGDLTSLRIRDLNRKAGHVEVRQTLQHIAGSGSSGRQSPPDQPGTCRSSAEPWWPTCGSAY